MNIWDAAESARVFANFRQYLTGWDEGRPHEGEVDYFRSGLTTPQFNGVVRVRSLSTIEGAVATTRAHLAGVPWWWWVGPDSPQDTPTALEQSGAAELTAVPVMVRPLDRVTQLSDAPTDLRIEEVRDLDRLTELVRTYSTSMGIPPGLEADMVRIESKREDNADIVRLAAVLDGRVVGTTVVITAQEVAGIFLVHVAEAHRRQGIGGALTSAALQVGRERGMRLAALVASPAGEPLYRRFGFTTVSEYRIFTVPA